MKNEIAMKNLTGKTFVEEIICFGSTTAREVQDVLYDDLRSLRKVLAEFGLPEDKEYNENDADFKEADRVIGEAIVYLNRVIDNLTKVVNKLDEGDVYGLMCDPYLYFGESLGKYLNREIGFDEQTRRAVAARELRFADYPDCM